MRSTRRRRTVRRCRCGRADTRSARRRTSRSRPGGGGSSTSSTGKRVVEPHRADRTGVVRPRPGVSATRPARPTRRSVSSRGRNATTVHELRPALGAGQRQPQRLQVATDRLQLAHELTSARLVEHVGAALAQLDEPLERRTRLVAESHRLRLEHLTRDLPHLDERARTAKRRAPAPPGACRPPRAPRRTSPRSRRSRAARAAPRRVDVVRGKTELVEVRPDRLRRQSRRRAGRRPRRAPCRFESFLPSSPRRRPWWMTGGSSPPSARAIRCCTASLGR